MTPWHGKHFGDAEIVEIPTQIEARLALAADEATTMRDTPRSIGVGIVAILLTPPSRLALGAVVAERCK